MKVTLPRFVLLVALAFVGRSNLVGQIVSVTDATSTPIPGSGHSYIQTLDETVNPANGSVSLRLPVAMRPGRGLNIPFGFAYDSTGAHFPGGSIAGQAGWNSNASYLSSGGWAYSLPMLSFIFGQHQIGSVTCPYYTGYVFQDEQAARYPLRLLTTPTFSGCPDGSITTAIEGPYQADTNGVLNVDGPDGTIYFFSRNTGCGPVAGPGGTGELPDLIEDRNGNKVTFSGPPTNCSGSFTMTDTLGTPALTSSGFGATGNTITVTGLQPYTINWGSASSNFSVQYQELDNDPQCRGMLGEQGTQPVIKSIVLPDQASSYNFEYTDAVSGLLTKITYPSGAYVSYQWGPTPSLTGFGEYGTFPNSANEPNCGIEYAPYVLQHRTVSFDGSTVAYTQDFTYTTVWNTSGAGWSSKTTTVKTNYTVGTNSYSFSTVYSYKPAGVATPPLINYLYGTAIPQEQSVTYNDVGGNPLKAVVDAWFDLYNISSKTTTPYNTVGVAGPSSLISYSYSTGIGLRSQLLEEDDYDFGNTTKPLKKTIWQYQPFPGTPIYPHYPSIVDRPCKIQTEDGNGNLFAETDYLYDNQSSACGSSGTPSLISASTPAVSHDETNYGATSSAARGNVTAIIKKCLLNCTDVTTSYTYDETGQMRSMLDPCGYSGTCTGDMPGQTNHTTNYSYDDKPDLVGDANPAGNTNAYLTQITRPNTGVVHTESYQYSYISGLLMESLDENGQKTTYGYGDPFLRLRDIYAPASAQNGGNTPHTHMDYTDTYPPSVTTTNPLGVQTQAIYDGMGHQIHTYSLSDSPKDYVDMTYNELGLISSVTNPYHSGDTVATTVYSYDALGRKTSQTQPDGNTQHWTYSANTVTFKDEANNQWQRTSDALGNLTQVLEPSVSNQAPTVTTVYTYTPLGDLLGVTQQGIAGEVPRVRTFSYDSLSRLTTATNPETGTICYGTYNGTNCGGGYDANGNLMSKTDGRGIVLTYKYDSLNRMTAKTSSDPSIHDSYSFDGSDGNSETNPNGRLTFESNLVNATQSYFYDEAGRLIKSSYCVPQDCHSNFSASASYDLAGNMTSLTYPDTRTVGQTFNGVGLNGAGRVSAIDFKSWNGNSVGTPYLTVSASAGYDAAGHVISATMGNGIKVTSSYTNREAVMSLGYTAGSQPVWSKQYTWYPNQNLQQIMDAITGVQRVFAYDNLNRLQSAIDLAGSMQSSGETTATNEEDDSNILDSMQQSGEPVWGSATATISPNSVAAPDGTLTADVVTVQAGTTDSWIQTGPPNPPLYSGEVVSGSVWLRVPSGTLATGLYLVATGDLGNKIAGQAFITLTTAWQKFTVTGTLQNGLTALAVQVGGAHTIAGGQIYHLWGTELQVVENTLQGAQPVGPPGWSSATATFAPNAAAAQDGTQTAGVVTVTSGATDSWIQVGVANPPSYSSQTVTGSVWLRVPSGTLTTILDIVQIGNAGWSAAGQTNVTLTTTWQQFYVSGPLQAGLTALAMQIGGAHTIAGGQVYQVWDAVVAPVSTDEGSGTNILPSSQQVGGASWGVQSGTPTNNAVVAPDGTTTAETLTASSGSSDTYQWDLVSNPAQYSGEQVTASIYLRVPSGTQTINLYIANSGVSGWSIAAQSTVTLNTSWQRFALTATTKPSLSQLYLQIGGGGTLTSGHSINVWGAQMVVGSNPEGYVPTQNTAVVNGGTQTLATNGLAESYSYDSFGNLRESGNYSFVQAYTAANQLLGWNYDDAGNLLYDGLGNAYQYDAEGKITNGAGSTYYYNAEGERVGKSGASVVDTIYFDGRPIARLSGGAWTDLIYGVNGLLAEVPGSQTGAPTYRMTDHLGSLVGTLSSAGAVLSTQDIAPFGEVFSGGSSDPFTFTGKERDTESGLDYFGARYYGSSMGRFTSPDSSDGPDTVPYARWANPQTLNLYSYGLNNPLSHVDPDGHDVQICANSSSQCYNVSDAQWAAIQKQNASGGSGGVTTDGKGFEGTGTILCGGSACGSATYFEPGLKDDTMGQIMMFIPVEKLAAPVLGKVGGMVAGLLGRAAVAGAENAAFKIATREMPAWVQSGGAFVSWLRQLAHDGVQLSAADADAVAAKAADFHVDVRLDPPHPGLYESPHLNIGKEGQVHLDVPQGYDHPTLPKGSARGPG